jgi:hypothetical protein
MRLIAILVAAFAISLGAFGDIVPIPGTEPVLLVFESADLVCNCVVESLRIVDEEKREQGGKPFVWRSVVAVVRVRDSYNKDVPGNSLIDVGFEDETPLTHAIPGLSPAETGIMFLRLSASGATYEFADKFLGVTPFTFLPVQQGAPGPARLQSALVGVLRGGGAEDQVNAMRLLQGLDQFSPGTLSSLVSLSMSADPEIALSSLAVLLKAKTPGAVERLASYLSAHKGGPEPLVLVNIGTQLGQVSNRDDLVFLEGLTSSEHLSIRLGALAGIRNMRSSHSAAVLAERLDDPDVNVRYLATITLAESFRKYGDYAPSKYLFDQNPEFYTRRWKSWWAEHGQGPSR